MSSTEAGAWDGLPPNPKLDGWHLVCGAPHLWDARNQCWKSHDGVEVFRYSPEKARRLNWTYGGPVRTDADIQLAQREAVEACKDVAERYLGGPASYRMRCEMSALIPPTPDLDAKLKEARRETWQMAIETLSKPLTVLGPITGHNGIQRVREACISALRARATEASL